MKNVFTAKPSVFTALLTSAIVLIVLLGTWTIAKAEGTMITICVRPNGLVYVIGDGFRRTDCRGRDQLLTWNTVGPAGADGATGPQGPMGPRGFTGAIGPQGPAGTTGRLNMYRVTSPIVSVGIAGTEIATATCGSGDQILSGGFFMQGSTMQILQSRPAVTTEAWQVEGSTANPPAGILPGIGLLAAYAWCSDLTP